METKKMTLEEAIEIAKNPVRPQTVIDASDPYAISIDRAEYAKSLVGKTLRSRDPKNTNTITIVLWIGQNYVVQINGDDYKVTPVMWILTHIDKMFVD